jgi:hypothetical protein
VVCGGGIRICKVGPRGMGGVTKGKVVIAQRS